MWNVSASLGCSQTVFPGGSCSPPEDSVPVDVSIVAGASVGGALFLAFIIALVVLKVAHSIADQREWAKFEREKEKSRWKGDDNPLFKSSTQEFENPLYHQ